MRTALEALVRYGLYPFVLLASVGVTVAMLAEGLAPGVALALTSLTFAALCRALELAFHPDGDQHANVRMTTGPLGWVFASR